MRSVKAFSSRLHHHRPTIAATLIPKQLPRSETQHRRLRAQMAAQARRFSFARNSGGNRFATLGSKSQSTVQTVQVNNHHANVYINIFYLNILEK